MLPNHGKARPALPLEGKQALMHKPRVPEHMLPTTVDWRGSGADSPVKDQASCGSCWVSCHSSSCFKKGDASAQATAIVRDRRDYAAAAAAAGCSFAIAVVLVQCEGSAA